MSTSQPPGTIRGLLETVAQPWIVRAADPLKELERVLWPHDPRNAQLSIRWLDGRRMRTVEDLWDELSAALQFPHWFGRNWNAVRDLLSAPEWELKRSYAIVARNAHDILADDHNADALTHFFGALRSVAERLAVEYEWSFDQRRPPTPFHVVLHTGPDTAGALRARLDAEGLDLPILPLRNPMSWE